MYKDAMIDIETLGTGSNAAIVSIGVVAFNARGAEPVLDYECYYGMDCDCYYGIWSDSLEEQQKDLNREINIDTLIWWMKQSDEAREVFNVDTRKATPVSGYLKDLNAFIMRTCVPDVRVWGNGAAFDNVILRNMYEAAGVKPFWKYSNDRCYRTVKNMVPDLLQNMELKPTEFEGVRHNALHDAKNQARRLQEYLACFRSTQ